MADKTYRYRHEAEDLRRAISAVLAGPSKAAPPHGCFEGIVGKEPLSGSR
jgi:hypothetical protein